MFNCPTFLPNEHNLCNIQSSARTNTHTHNAFVVRSRSVVAVPVLLSSVLASFPYNSTTQHAAEYLHCLVRAHLPENPRIYLFTHVIMGAVRCISAHTTKTTMMDAEFSQHALVLRILTITRLLLHFWAKIGRIPWHCATCSVRL